MYVERNYTASVVTSESTRFSCMHCNYECDAMVTGIGEGHGRSPFFLDNSGASARASDEAAGAARENMHYALRAAKCPHCGKSDSGAKWHVYTMSALRGLVIGALVGVAILAALKGSMAGWLLGAIGWGIVAAIMTIARAQRMLTGAILHPNDLVVKSRFR